MSIAITIETVEASYELLRTTLPFRRWKLPAADDLCIELTHSREVWGKVFCHPDGHKLQVSAKRHHTLPELLKTIAHEMCHLREFALTKDCKHGAAFHKLADQACRAHGFDRGAF